MIWGKGYKVESFSKIKRTSQTFIKRILEGGPKAVEGGGKAVINNREGGG